MKTNIILLGYSVLLELLINKFNTSLYKIIIFEDDSKKIKKISDLKLSFLKVLNFNEGHELISNSKNNFDTFIGVSSNSKKRSRF